MPRARRSPPASSLADVERTARRAVREVGPRLATVKKWGNEWYAGNDLVCAVFAFRHHVGVEFWRGAALAADHPTLEGTGKNLRHVKLRTTDEARSGAFAQLVRAAVRLDRAMAKRSS